MSDGVHILQAGVPRSGNVWLQRLVRGLLDQAGVELRQAIAGHPVSEALKDEEMAVRGLAEADFLQIGPLGTFFAIPGVFRWPVNDLDDYVSRTTYVSSHSPWNAGSLDVYRRFTHILYLIRDPRDVAISTSRFFYTPFNRRHRPQPWPGPDAFLKARFTELIRSWTGHVGGHLESLAGLPVHVLFYERLVERTGEELGEVARFLGLDVDEDAIDRACAASRLDRVRAEHPGHVHRGRWGGWRADLEPGEQEAAARIAGGLLRSLGYPVTAAEAEEWRADEARPRSPGG